MSMVKGNIWTNDLLPRYRPVGAELPPIRGNTNALLSHCKSIIPRVMTTAAKGIFSKPHPPAFRVPETGCNGCATAVATIKRGGQARCYRRHHELSGGEMLIEERLELVPWDQVHAVSRSTCPAPGTMNTLWLGRPLVGIFAELPGVSNVTRMKSTSRRNRLERH